MSGDVSLIDAVNAHVTPGMVAGISRETGLSPLQAGGLVRRSISTVVAAMVGSASTEQGASRLLLASTEAAHQSGGGRRDDVGLIFGDRTSIAVDTVARSGRTTRDVAARVVASITPIALAVLGNEAIARHLTPAGLKQFLETERISNVEPIGNAETVTVVSTPEPRPTPPAPIPRAMHWGWVAAIVALVIVMGLAWSALHGRTMTSQTTTTGTTIDRPDWAMYQVTFDATSPQLTRDGEGTVKNLADAMTANPNARIKLVGVSSRAAMVKNALVERGIDASRIEVDATKDGRADNRRVDVAPIGP